MQVDIPSSFVALILENCKLPYANHGHVILADPSPILFYPISSTEVRCLVDVPGKKVPSISNGEMSHFLKSVVAPQVYIYIYMGPCFKSSSEPIFYDDLNKTMVLNGAFLDPIGGI